MLISRTKKTCIHCGGGVFPLPASLPFPLSLSPNLLTLHNPAWVITFNDDCDECIWLY